MNTTDFEVIDTRYARVVLTVNNVYLLDHASNEYSLVYGEASIPIQPLDLYAICSATKYLSGKAEIYKWSFKATCECSTFTLCVENDKIEVTSGDIRFNLSKKFVSQIKDFLDEEYGDGDYANYYGVQ